MSVYKQDLRGTAGYVQGLRDIAETAQSCIRLVLSDGGQVYLKSTWEATNFSIVILDGNHAWSRTVSAKDVVSIATSWNIDVGEFMKSARSHLCRQYPTSCYLLTPDMDIRVASNVVQLSFTIENLFEGIEGNEKLNFKLHLTRISDVGAVFRDMLQHLLDTKDKLEEQLKEAERQYQKKLHQFTASEPEPSITLSSFARPSATPRRQSSSFMEPRLLDSMKFNRSEERDATRLVCSLTPMRAHDQLNHDTLKVAIRLPLPPSFDLQDHGDCRAKSGFPDEPRGQWATEARGPVRHEFAVENPIWQIHLSMLRMADTPEYTRQKSTCSHLPVVELPGRKRAMAEDEGRGMGRGRGRGSRGRGRRMQKHHESSSEKGRRGRLRSDPSPEGHVLDPDKTNVDIFRVPDPDFYDFDKERTEELIVPGQVWAVYDEKDGFPRVCVLVDKVSRRPQFEVLITWLIPYNPSTEAVQFFQKSGYPISCGKFELGGEQVLTSINIFSHRMEFNWLSRNMGTIYPKKGEVWAIYTKKMLESGFATPGGGANTPFFRVVHVLEDLGAEMRPYFSVLEKVNAFRTVWKPRYQPGSTEPKYLTHFSHKVPACQLQGNEGPNAAGLEGCWDIDPAALPTSQSTSNLPI